MKCFETEEGKWKLVFGLGLFAGVMALIIGVGTPIVLTFPYDQIFRQQVEDWVVIDSKVRRRGIILNTFNQQRKLQQLLSYA